MIGRMRTPAPPAGKHPNRTLKFDSYNRDYLRGGGPFLNNSTPLLFRLKVKTPAKMCRLTLFLFLMVESFVTRTAEAWIFPGTSMMSNEPTTTPAFVHDSPCSTRCHSTALYLSNSLGSSEQSPGGGGGSSKLYQRIFYQWTPSSDVDQFQNLVLETRQKYDATTLQPLGKTVLFRDGNVEDGEIGDEFYTLHIPDSMKMVSEEVIATGMYLAANPETLCQNDLLQVAAGDSDSFWASVIGCVGAAHALNNPNDPADMEVDILSLPSKQSTRGKGGLPYPKSLERLTLSDTTEQGADRILHALQASKLVTNQVHIQVLDWKQRSLQERHRLPREYQTVLASNMALTVPEAKEFARTVAYRTKAGKGQVVHVAPDYQDTVYLRQSLEKGYKMTCRSGFLKLEKIAFEAQELANDASESLLDEMELAVQSIVSLPYQALNAQHHPDYRGEGTGEMFFPAETGFTELETDGGYDRLL